MLAKYAYDQSSGSDPGVLSALGKQITAAAKAMGQHATLPRGSPPAPPPVSKAQGKVNVTA
jgi:hypothetical protein